MNFGAAYYPEHWPEERWPYDVRLMRRAGINTLRLGEFAWYRMEPAEGRFDFSWLDRALKVLADEGVKVILGTPTASPPKWLMNCHPDIYPVDKYGKVAGFGSRRHYCPNNPEFHDHTRKIVNAMAAHYGANPQIIGWQVDNEFSYRCFCDNCLTEFRVWIKEKYKTIKELNKQWGTEFWSQQLDEWEDVYIPMFNPNERLDANIQGLNPGMLLDYYRFCSDSYIKYQKIQIEIIRKYSNEPITHNLIANYGVIDYFKLGSDLDIVSLDVYPSMQWSKNPYHEISMCHDHTRGIKKKNYWVMEQQSGPCGWGVLGDTPEPGQIRLWTYQSIAHGAEAIMYFRWRACTFGTEQYWYGILDHDGVPGRRYDEIQQIGKEIQRLSGWFEGSKVSTEIALLKSYDNLWSHSIQPHNHRFDYNRLLMSYYEALVKNNLNCDIINHEDDFTMYKVVIIPAFSLVKEDVACKLDKFVNGGGVLILTFRSGIRTWNNTMTTDTLPGEFKSMVGAEVEEFDSLNWGRTVSVKGEIGEGICSMWCDVMKPLSAKGITFYDSHYYKGKAAVTKNTYGKGKVYYVGCDLDNKVLRKLMHEVIAEAGIQPALICGIDGVEAVRKEKNGRMYTILLNHNGHETNVQIEGCYTDLISDTDVNGSLILPAYGVSILI